MALNLAISVLSTVVTAASGGAMWAECEDIDESGRFWRKSAVEMKAQPLLRWVALSMDSRRRQDNAFRPAICCSLRAFSEHECAGKDQDPRGHEVWRDFGRQYRAHSRSGPARQTGSGCRPRGCGRGLRHVGDDQPAGRLVR